MSLSGKKQTWQKVVYSRITLAVVLLLCAALSLSVYDRYTIEREMAARLSDKEKELQKVQKRQSELEKQVEYLSDERGVEAEIRKHFDVAKEGEQVIVLVDNNINNATTSRVEKPKSQESSGFWSWLFSW